MKRNEANQLFQIVLPLFLLSILLTSCSGEESPSPTPVLPPGEGSWPQFHGDSANHGVYFASSTFAYEPKWSIDVGPVVYSSPVIGGDRTIYIGNLDGELISIDWRGWIKWRTDLGEPIISTPAVSHTGFIWVVTTRVLDEQNDEYISTLHTLSPMGSLVRSIILPDNAFTTASPTLWRSSDSEYIFLYARRDVIGNASLLIYDQAGELLINQKVSHCSLTSSNPIWDWFDLIWDLIKDFPVEFPSGVIRPLYEEYGWIDPTIAVVDAPIFSEYPIVISTYSASCSTAAYSWDPPNLTFLWSNEEEAFLTSSPANLRGTKTIVFGTNDGEVLAYDMLTGDKLWTTTVNGGAVMGTPASYGIGSQIFILSHNGTLTGLSASDGSELREISIEGEAVSSPAMSSDLVYVQTTEGLVSINRSFESWAATASAKGGGLASPAIGADGTIYTVAISGNTAFLKAYGGTSIFPPQVDPTEPVAR